MPGVGEQVGKSRAFCRPETKGTSAKAPQAILPNEES
jgi:hypothetical protein